MKEENQKGSVYTPLEAPAAAPRVVAPVPAKTSSTNKTKKITKKELYIYIYLRGGFAGEVEEEDAQLPLFSLGSGAKQPQREERGGGEVIGTAVLIAFRRQN